MHDLPALKAAHPLLQRMQADQHVFKKIGPGVWTCLCPFHTERTPSCRVYEDDHHYHCFGCGASGTVLDYLMQTRGWTLKETIDHLADSAGLPQPLNHRPAPAKPAEVKPLTTLSTARFEAWQNACERLTLNPREIQRLADWRGFSPDTIRGAAEAQLMAIWPYWDQPREAFLVEAPAHWFTDPLLAELNGPQQFLPHAIHCRLSPHTPGNPHAKQSWRYDPAGSKSWPFLWGNPIGARWLFFLEGQWDALALADLCGWHTPDSLPPGTAIIGLRGATSWKLMLHEQHGIPLDPQATAIAIGDADTAGAKWYEKGGFLQTLEGRVKRLISLMPTHPQAKDFNDLCKLGAISGAEFLRWIRQRLTQARPVPRPKLTFAQWCKAAQIREDEIGRAARLVARDPHRPVGRKSPVHWRTYWRGQHLAEADVLALHTILQAWHTLKEPLEAQSQPA